MRAVRWYNSAAFSIALLAMLAGLVVAPCVLFAQAQLLDRARERAIAEYLRDLVDPGDPSTCETLQLSEDSQPRGPARPSDPGAPRATRGPYRTHGPPVLVFDANFNREGRFSDRFPSAVRKRLEQGSGWASAEVTTPRGDLRFIVAAVDGGEGCAYLATMRPVERRERGRAAILVAVSVGSAFAAMLAAFLPSLSLVRRLRDLAGRVEGGGDPDSYRVDGKDEISMISDVFSRKSRDLVLTQEALIRSQRSIEEHVAQTSHDLRTPLTVLQQRLYRARNADEAEAGAHIDSAMAEASYISSLLGNLNTVARLGGVRAADIHDAQVDLSGVVRRVVQRYLPLANSRDVSLESGLPSMDVSVFGDATLVEQMISNLLENSVKHVGEGGHVALVLEAAKVPGDETSQGSPVLRERPDKRGRFHLYFRDSGDGPADEVWHAAREASAEPELGTGTARVAAHGGGKGLAIAMRIANLHGWTITRRSLDDGFEIAVSG